MTAQQIVLLFALLTLKHFIVDFLMQTEYQWRNKGDIRHMGGYVHASLHMFATLFILLGVFGNQIDRHVSIFLGLGEAMAHYLIDWSKVNINKKMGWDANKNPEFWYLLGLDQFLHGMCYVFICYIATCGLNLTSMD